MLRRALAIRVGTRFFLVLFFKDDAVEEEELSGVDGSEESSDKITTAAQVLSAVGGSSSHVGPSDASTSVPAPRTLSSVLKRLSRIVAGKSEVTTTSGVL